MESLNKMGDVKVFLVRPPLGKRDWDLGDVLAIARSEGKKLLRTEGRVRVLDLISRPYGYVAYVVKAGCSGSLEVNEKIKENK